jgi:flavin reductase (DIM6/NTAB) family NADH-FMN oxidoreductase RutF
MEIHLYQVMQNNILSISNQSLVFNRETGVRYGSAATGRASPAPSTAIERSIVIEPSVLYFGTPVVLAGTTNEDGSSNLAPISCVWWLGWSCVLGLDVSSKTTRNLDRAREGVLNLPSAHLVGAVDRLACLTGSNQIPDHKMKMGYRYEPNKFEVAGLTPVASDLVKAPRARECPVQLEAVVENIRPFGENDSDRPFPAVAVEMRVVRVHVHESLVVTGKPNRVDPEKWRPLITSFRQYFGLGSTLHPSKFGEIPEETFVPNRFQPEPESVDSVEEDILAA